MSIFIKLLLIYCIFFIFWYYILILTLNYLFISFIHVCVFFNKCTEKLISMNLFYCHLKRSFIFYCHLKYVSKTLERIMGKVYPSLISSLSPAKINFTHSLVAWQIISRQRERERANYTQGKDERNENLKNSWSDFDLWLVDQSTLHQCPLHTLKILAWGKLEIYKFVVVL